MSPFFLSEDGRRHEDLVRVVFLCILFVEGFSGFLFFLKKVEATVGFFCPILRHLGLGVCPTAFGFDVCGKISLG